MRTACLCIHGFTGSPLEIEPLLSFLQKNGSWDIFAPTLPGHCDGKGCAAVRKEEWLDCVEHCLQKILEAYEHVYLVGFSMGGIIASVLAAKYPVGKLVLLSAAARYGCPKQLFSDVKGVIKDFLHGKGKSNELYRTYKPKFTRTSIGALKEFCSMVSVSAGVYGHLTLPVFIAQGMKDGMVPWRTAESLYQVIPSAEKRLYLVSEGKHMICYCRENRLLFQEIQHFLEK
ncbi:alpha/beta hydrolase [Bacillus sp. 1P06AnD]|uniref:alpha/beta hydrolase n=1 Tax=Bacillus sp. 1P06AnD TaxID=3132208 RepID=UPI0039A37859